MSTKKRHLDVLISYSNSNHKKNNDKNKKICSKKYSNDNTAPLIYIENKKRKIL